MIPGGAPGERGCPGSGRPRTDTSRPRPIYTEERTATIHPRSPAPMHPLPPPAAVAGVALPAARALLPAAPAGVPRPVALPAAAARADFPPVSQLPSRPELPDPLVMLNGDRVTTKEQWFDKRRPELKALFQHYMYGTFPPPAKIDAKVEREDPRALDGRASLKEITIDC